MNCKASAEKSEIMSGLRLPTEGRAETRVVREYWEPKAFGRSTEIIDPRGDLELCP